MNLQTFTKLIDNTIDDEHAISLLHTFYTDLNEEDKEIFITALIGHAVTSHKLLKYLQQK